MVRRFPAIAMFALLADGSDSMVDVSRSCKWIVKDQTQYAFKPTLLEANVEESCPFESNYGVHLETCEKCAAQHRPCNDTYIACGGCCGTPWHSKMNLGVNTRHTCVEIKHYFDVRNSVKVECEEADESNKDKEGNFNVEIKDAEKTEVVEEGELITKCKTPINELKCEKIPFKMEFDCSDCGIQGTPDLLNQCCDKCVEWGTKVEAVGHPGIPDGIQPFVWCKGCNASKIVPLDERLKDSPFPWHGAPNYVDWTEEKADKDFENFIEDNVCSLLSPECPADGGRRLGFLEQPSPRELQGNCLGNGGGVCAAWDHPEDLGEADLGDGRRLAELKDENAMCPSLNPALYDEPRPLPAAAAKHVTHATKMTIMKNMTDDPLQISSTTTEMTQPDAATTSSIAVMSVILFVVNV